MTHDARVGDTVRLMIPIVGVVKPEYGGSVRGYSIHSKDGRTVEILERMLPTEPGYYLSENEAKVQGVLQLTVHGIWWWIGNMNCPSPEMLTHDEARTYGQLQRLTVTG